MGIARLGPIDWRLVLLAGCALALPLGAAAQDAQDAKFAAPKRIHAGEKLAGEGRLYPSPALHDVNGDGKADLVLGDLTGRITYAPAVAGTGGASFGPEKKLNGADGKQLKFHNW